MPCGAEGHEATGVLLKYEQVTRMCLLEGVLGVSPAGPLLGQEVSRAALGSQVVGLHGSRGEGTRPSLCSSQNHVLQGRPRPGHRPVLLGPLRAHISQQE